MFYVLFQTQWEEYLLVAPSLRAGSLWPDRSRGTSSRTHQKTLQRNFPRRFVLFLYITNRYVMSNLAWFENCLSIMNQSYSHVYSSLHVAAWENTVFLKGLMRWNETNTKSREVLFHDADSFLWWFVLTDSTNALFLHGSFVFISQILFIFPHF